MRATNDRHQTTMSEVKKDAKTLKLTNVRVKYCKVIKPGKAYDDGAPDEWSTNMYVTPEDRDTLMANGVNPKEDKEGHEYWLAKRKTVNTKSEAVKPPVVVDGSKRPFTDDIGNGSVCNVAVTLFPWERKGKSGVLLYLNAVQVVNHVPFSGAGGADAFDVVTPDEDTDAAAAF